MDPTDDERALGFDTSTLGGEQVVALQLRYGLYAVKRATNGVVEYAICDARLRTLYSPAKSLEELRRRFSR